MTTVGDTFLPHTLY